MKELLLKNSFPVVIGASLLFATVVGGFIQAGMFMGLVSTMALWFLVNKFPVWLKRLMAKHMLAADIALTALLFVMFSMLLGPGPTAFMCTVTQATVLSVLLLGLRYMYSPEAESLLGQVSW